MPTYEYECKKCNYRIEVKASVKEKSEGLKIKCPECGSEDVKQLFGSVCCITSEGGNDSGSGCSCCG
jgi:putative FmdB family regulatory protein